MSLRVRLEAMSRSSTSSAHRATNEQAQIDAMVDRTPGLSVAAESEPASLPIG